MLRLSSEIRLKVERLEVMFGSCETCAENSSKYLQTLDQYDLTQYCLGYIFTYL